MRRVLLSLFVLLAAGLAVDSAWARSLEVEDFHAVIEVQADGRVTVEERIRVAFQGSWNGIYRNVKIGYTYAGGQRGRLRVDVHAIQDESGNPLEHWKEWRDSYLNLKIRVPGAMDAVRTVVIRYTAQNVIRPQETGDEDFGVQDELYWNITGDAWDMPILQASAEIRLPSSVPAETVRARAYTGRRGEQSQDSEIASGEGPVVTVRTTKLLHPGEGLTAAVVFQPGHVAYPSAGRRAAWWFQDNWFLLLAPLFLAAWFLAWWFWGRDPMRNRTIIPEWEPPDGLRPSEVGILVDDQFDQRDLTATVIDLAVRGVVTIHEEVGDYRLVLDPDVRARTSLETYEKHLVRALFPGDQTEVSLLSLKHDFVSDMETIKNSILDHLVGTGYFQRRPDKVMERWGGWTFVVLIGLVVLGFILTAPPLYWILTALCGIPMFVLSRQMPRRTKRGLDALARVKGMEEYLVTAEKERMKDLPLDHFETLLPYAVALGVQKRWAEAFEDLFTKQPTWFKSDTATFDAQRFDRTLSDMNRSVGSSLMSGPRAASSTGGSGWSGGWSGGGGFSGGSSGGGFGGGGGGGW